MSKRFLIAAISSLLLTGCTSNPTMHDVSLADLPAAVRDGFAKSYPQGAIQGVEKEIYKDGTIHWEVTFRDIAGAEHKVEMDNAGNALEKH